MKAVAWGGDPMIRGTSQEVALLLRLVVEDAWRFRSWFKEALIKQIQRSAV